MNLTDHFTLAELTVSETAYSSVMAMA